MPIIGIYPAANARTHTKIIYLYVRAMCKQPRGRLSCRMFDTIRLVPIIFWQMGHGTLGPIEGGGVALRLWDLDFTNGIQHMK